MMARPDSGGRSRAACGSPRIRGRSVLPMPATPGHPIGGRSLIEFFERSKLRIRCSPAHWTIPRRYVSWAKLSFTCNQPSKGTYHDEVQ
jgi:hypothetical protein